MFNALGFITREITSNFKPNPQPRSVTDIRSDDDKAFLQRCKEKLEALEYARLNKLRNFEFRKKVGIPAALIALPICGYIDWMLFFFPRSNNDSFAGLTLLVMGGIYWWVTQPKRQYARAYKIQILPKIAELFGNLTYDIDGKIGMDYMQPSRIVPHHDRYESEDYFTGEYKGVHMEFSEINLKQRRRSNKSTHYVSVFKGLAVLLNTKHKRFYGHTILEKDRHALLEWFEEKTKGLERAEMVDPEFEEIFDAYTNDQVEARYLIDPKMIESLKGLYAEYDGHQMAAAFYVNRMLILIASKHNHFEPPNIYLPASDPEGLLNMKREVGQILSIIDKLSLYDPDEVHKNAAQVIDAPDKLGLNNISSLRGG